MPESAEILADLVRALAPLMDRDYCQPFMSCWELDPHMDYPDGQDLHEQVRQAWEVAKRVTDV